MKDYIERLIKDPSFIVRAAVAEQGYGLDRLIYDSNSDVRYYAVSLFLSVNKEDCYK